MAKLQEKRLVLQDSKLCTMEHALMFTIHPVIFADIFF